MQEWKLQKSHAQIFYCQKNSIPQSFTSFNNIMACYIILCDTNSIQRQATETNTVQFCNDIHHRGIKNKTKQNKNNDTLGTDTSNQLIWKKLINNDHKYYILSYFFKQRRKVKRILPWSFLHNRWELWLMIWLDRRCWWSWWRSEHDGDRSLSPWVSDWGNRF